MLVYLFVIFSIILVGLSIRKTKNQRIKRMVIGLVYMFLLSSYPILLRFFVEIDYVKSAVDVAGVILMYAVFFLGGLSMVIMGLFTKPNREVSA